MSFFFLNDFYEIPESKKSWKTPARNPGWEYCEIVSLLEQFTCLEACKDDNRCPPSTAVLDNKSVDDVELLPVDLR